MANSASSAHEGIIDMTRLASHVRNKAAAEELQGALESLLCASLQTSQAAHYAELLVVTGSFDCSRALVELTLDNLVELGVNMGHRNIVLRAVFNGIMPTPQGTPAPQPQEQPLPPPPVPSVGSPYQKEFRREWPETVGPDGLPTAADLTQFGLSARGHLRDINDQVTAAEMWRRVEDPSSAIPLDWPHASPMDARFARILQGAGKHGMPAGIARVMTTLIERDQGMRAWRALCTRVFVTTEVANAKLKFDARTPVPETDARKVSARLGQHDADLAELLARGFTHALDDGDTRHAYYGLVGTLDVFSAAVESLKSSVPGGVPSVAVVRQRLGEMAADLARPTDGNKQPAKPKAKAAAAAAKKKRA
jgi:hypothetical protein